MVQKIADLEEAVRTLYEYIDHLQIELAMLKLVDKTQTEAIKVLMEDVDVLQYYG